MADCASNSVVLYSDTPHLSSLNYSFPNCFATLSSSSPPSTCLFYNSRFDWRKLKKAITFSWLEQRCVINFWLLNQNKLSFFSQISDDDSFRHTATLSCAFVIQIQNAAFVICRYRYDVRKMQFGNISISDGKIYFHMPKKKKKGPSHT